MEPEFLDYIDGDESILEKEPLETIAKENQLLAFLHDGFWHCIDTKRDKDNLDKLVNSGNKLW